MQDLSIKAAQPAFFVKKANVQATQEARQAVSKLKQEPDVDRANNPRINGAGR